MFFMNSLNQTMVHHPSRSVVKICQVVLTIAWIIAAAMSSLPLFASTSYRDYPSLFACDIADMRILVTSDGFVFCMPALAVLAMSLYIIASEPFRHRLSYAVTPGRVDIHSCEDLQIMKRGAKAGVVISAAMFMDWIVRITAVLGTDISSKSLLTLSVFFMLINVLCVPSCLLLVSRLPAVQISFQNSPEGMGYTNPETSFHFPPLRADFNVNSVSSSTDVNIRAADLCLNQDVYRRGFQHIPCGRDLQNTPDGRDLQNTPDGRDLQNTPDGRDLQNTLDGRDLQNTPDGRDLQNTPDLQNTLCERVFHNSPPGRDLQNTSSEVNADSVSSSLAPHPDLKRNSVSCMLSVGSWINNEQK
ncbi:uncharacterized protein LOC124133282 [Haliotis rufescens]|uniref:uncharacterized protein LOC124133282 n=1 Tax=Haliotis rufescens TaxID=6454 RepID=UPI00201E79BA|nr:uncharacterized protein LOC124133282 [Haliotis rufescens]